MAEEEDLDDDEEGAGGKPIGMIIGIIVGLLVLGGGGYYAYINFFQEKPAEEKPAEGEEGKKEEAPAEEDLDLGVMFPMDPFIVNLAGSEGKRFLKVTIFLELSTPEVREEIKGKIQKVTDSILVLLSSKAFEDVYSVQGKFKLKGEITTRVNRFLVVGHIKDAYFTEFIIQ
ncbi:MAG: flagellar basal body-associated FliL family protein [Nitrospinota bacterium]|nr:flagellar basal body-associated FliL family protein [Nitrospinota bacterium]